MVLIIFILPQHECGASFPTKNPPQLRGIWFFGSGLHWSDAGGLQAFGTCFDCEFDLLTLVKALEATGFDGREMDEYVRAAFALDETEALAGVEPLDCTDYTFAHCFLLLTTETKRMRYVAYIRAAETKKSRTISYTSGTHTTFTNSVSKLAGVCQEPLLIFF